MAGRRNVNQQGATTSEAITGKAKKTVEASSTEICGLNGNRSQIIFSPPAKTIYLALGVAAATGEGIELNKEAKVPFVLTGWTGKVFAIGAEATTVPLVEF
jgi:hypothetical protein